MDTEGPYPAGKSPAPAATTPSGAYPPPFPGTSRYAAPPPPDVSSLGESAPAGERERAMIDDFVVAEAALLATGASCIDACRALRSMQRAAAGICAMTSGTHEQRRCEEVGARYRAARERVRAACKECTQGPSLQPDAPIEGER